MNQKKLAEILHVSPSTVSKALSGSNEISQEIKDAVQKLAIDMGYFKEKSRRKRDYNKNSDLLIALVVPEVMGFYYSTIITYMKNEIEARGGQVAVYIYDFSHEKANKILKSIILREGADGVLFFAKPELDTKPNIPIVTVDCKVEDYDSVCCDAYEIIEDSVKYLYSLGHRKIGYVGEPNTVKGLGIFKEVMQKAGLDVNDEFIYFVKNRFEAIGEEAVCKIAEQKDRPTALIAAYDEVAISLTNHLNRCGIKVPDDISVIGKNNISSSAHTSPPLTTIDTFSSEQFEAAVSLLFDKIINEEKSVKHITIQHKIIERETTNKIN